MKSPEYVHTWRLTHLSLWNAASAGHDADEVIEVLHRFAKFPVPPVVPETIREIMGKFGALRLVRDGEFLRLEAESPADLDEVRHLRDAQGLLDDEVGRPERAHSPQAAGRAQAGAAVVWPSRR